MTLEELRQRLEAARTQMDTPGEQPDGCPNDKAGAVHGLAAIAEYLRAAGLDRPTIRILGDVMGAIADADAGTDNPLIRKRKVRNRAPNSHDFRMLQAGVAAYVTLANQGGKPLEAAARHAALRFGTAGYRFGLPRAKSAEWEAIIEMRDSIKAGKKGRLPRDHYHYMLGLARDTPAGDAAEVLLVSLLNMHRANTVKTPPL